MALLQVSRDIGFTAVTDRDQTPSFGRRQTGIGPKRTSIHAVPLIMTVTPARMHVATMGCSTASGESQLCSIACGVPEAPFKHIMSNLYSPLEVFRDMAPQQCGLVVETQEGCKTQVSSHSLSIAHSPVPVPVFALHNTSALCFRSVARPKKIRIEKKKSHVSDIVQLGSPRTQTLPQWLIVPT